jgi:hypothetical protein
LNDPAFRRAERCRCNTSVKSTNLCAEADAPPSADPLDEGTIDPAPPVPLPDIALLACQYSRLGCCVTNGSFLDARPAIPRHARFLRPEQSETAISEFKSLKSRQK